MKYSTRCRYWFIIQVVAVVVYYSGKVSSSTKTAQSCEGSRLDLTCPSTKVIKVTDIYRGISSCSEAACCIKDAKCDQRINEEHKRFVQNTCDDQQNCRLDISSVKVPCTSGWWWGKTTTDGHAYEKITYSCKDTPRDNVTSTAEAHTKLYDNISEEGGRSTGGQTADVSTSQALPVVMVTICLILMIAIIVLVVVMYRRKKLSQSKLLHPIEMTDVDNGKNETTIYANENQGTSLHENNDSLPPLYSLPGKADLSLAEEDQTLYTDVEIMKTDWNQSEFDRSTTINAANPPPNAGPDVYTVVNKPSKHAATSFALKTGVPEKQGLKGFATTGDGASSEVAEDIYANEPAAVSSTRSVAGTISKTQSPQDDGGVTVIENDLYCH